MQPQHFVTTRLTGHVNKGAKSSLDLQEEFSSVVQWIADTRPDLFTTAEWNEPGGDLLPSITLTKPAPAGIISKVRALPFDVEIRTGANANADELRQLSATAIQAVVESTSPTNNVSSVIDSDSLGVTIEYGADGSLQGGSGSGGAQGPRVTADQLLMNVVAKLGVTELPVPIQVKVAGGPDIARLEATVRGGYSLAKTVGGPYDCTSGFSATRSGVKGVITADHCVNTLYYEGAKNVISYVTGSPAFGVDASGKWYYDMQFHKTLSGHSTSPSFRAWSGGTRTVTGISDPVKGESVCHYGMASGIRCDVVYSTNSCLYFGGDTMKTYCKLAYTLNNVSAGGDSGGPWFSGSVAKGTHTGAGRIDGAVRSIFTAISARSAISATVMTG